MQQDNRREIAKYVNKCEKRTSRRNKLTSELLFTSSSLAMMKIDKTGGKQNVNTKSTKNEE